MKEMRSAHGNLRTFPSHTINHTGGDGDQSRLLPYSQEKKGYDSQIIEHPICEADQENGRDGRQPRYTFLDRHATLN